jgi:predicted dithiol-disulfide oxidoreductase (DUF899 family)
LVNQQQRLAELKRRLPREEVRDYALAGWEGPVKLSELFGSKPDLIVIHNMGTGCRYCTLWADGFNGVRSHLESRAGFVVVSPDKADAQRAFAESRGWKFRMASGQGSTFIEDMGFRGEKSWRPGVSTFAREGGKIYRVAKASFGPYDPFCGVWHLMGLLQDGEDGWEPQYRYDG